MWHKPLPEAKFYAHPISGLYVIVDLHSCQVVVFDNEAKRIALLLTPGPYR
jgi:primary-amine oxidase